MSICRFAGPPVIFPHSCCAAYAILSRSSRERDSAPVDRNMNDQLRGDEKFVMDSVARWCSGTWRCGEDPPDAYLTVNKREIAVEISTLMESRNDGRGGTVSQQSDFMPAKQLAEELDKDLQEEIPYGRTVLLVLKWPFSNKRAVKEPLKAAIRQLLPSESTERKLNIDGNEITIAISSDCDSPGCVDFIIINSALPRNDVLTTAWCILEERIAAKAHKCSSLQSKGPLWLALLNRYPLADIEKYQRAMNMFSVDHTFEKILLVSHDGSVNVLFENNH